jgi:hypothetical protein
MPIGIVLKGHCTTEYQVYTKWFVVSTPLLHLVQHPKDGSRFSWPEMPGPSPIGLASDANRKWLADHGVIPVAYGDAVEDRIRAASCGKVDAFIRSRRSSVIRLARSFWNRNRMDGTSASPTEAPFYPLYERITGQTGH